MPGPLRIVPSRVTFTLVSSGNTVSRCAATTRCGRAVCPGRSPRTLPGLVEPYVLQTELHKRLAEHVGAGAFLEGRRGHFAKTGFRPRSSAARSCARPRGLRGSPAPGRASAPGPGTAQAWTDGQQGNQDRCDRTGMRHYGYSTSTATRASCTEFTSQNRAADRNSSRLTMRSFTSPRSDECASRNAA